MKKIKILLLALLVIASSSMLKAQSEMTYEQMIPVRVLMPTNKDVKGDALTVLYNRLNQAVSLNGLGSSTNESRFIIVTSVTILSKDVTASIPPQFKAEVEMTFYFVDNVQKVIMSQETITKKGMDNDDNKAVAKAIKSVQARDPKLKKLINIGKQRAVEYYKTLEALEKAEEKEDTNETPDVTWVLED